MPHWWEGGYYGFSAMRPASNSYWGELHSIFVAMISLGIKTSELFRVYRSGVCSARCDGVAKERRTPWYLTD